ncbi:MAG TPA: molybdopterin-dependent oxidoreductase [Methylibium sp.]|uniref:nitrate reductase n=1 Tax=Methylibium sp. TaxID=2067992 RepID=UPI002DBD9CDB|nr:molybdopterin-dependent oxidoreductase [Methylibium sp.]HEU4459877.1 molybdopterin-dependent oxidoreductase [Methylibium sp.]
MSALRETRSTCPYCGVGCGVIIESQGAQITNVRGDPEHPANFGRLCTKGSTLHLTATRAVTLQTRLLRPLRRAHKHGELQAITWDAALDEAAARFAATIEAHGPDAVGFYLSGQLLTEDYYVFNKIAKGLVGTNNVDTNSRLCMSSAVAGYKATLGADAPPACYDDLNHANTVFITGSNAAWAHPILFRRLEDARAANPALKLIVADPRRTETAAVADLHLQLLPGTDVALCHGLLHLLLWEGLTDAAFIAAHTSGFEALRDRVREYTPKHVAQLCGLKEADIVQAARWFGQHTPTLSLYCQGLNQSAAGTDKNAALINLHLATGQIGKRGAGPFSLTGQPNAMGGREVGGLANLLSAHRDLANPQHRAEVAALWGLPDVPATPGKSAVEMFEAAADGAIKALWISCTNPAQSMPDQAAVRRALERCDFVVLQEAFATTATARYADLLLPATTWGEKDGTVTNSERRISRVRPAVTAPGEARHDWAAAVAFAQRLEARLAQQPKAAARLPLARTGRTLFAYATPEAVWNEHRESTRGRDLDITGLSYPKLDAAPQCWPCPEGASGGRERLYEDGIFPTPDGRARFADMAYRGVAEPRDARFPFALNTGRLRDHWHGMSRTGTLGRLFGHVAEPAIELHPQELARRGWRDGDLVHVTSRRGSLLLPVQGSESVAPAQAFVAMHWGEEFVGGRASGGSPKERDAAAGRVLAGVNAVTTGAYCPQSKQPELKHAAVKLLKAELPWQLLAAAWLPEDQALLALQRLRGLLPAFDYAHCVPFGREPHARGVVGVLLRAAAPQAPGDERLAEIEALFGLAGAKLLRYSDPRHGQRRTMKLTRNEAHATRLDAFLLAGDLRAAGWIRALLQDELPADAYGRLLLSPAATPPAALAARGTQVCACFDVSEPRIVDCLAATTGSEGERLAQLQGRLKCGTNCGSCIPALHGLVRASMAAA